MLSCGDTDHLFNKSLTIRNWTEKEAREAAISGGLCLAPDQTILDFMGEHLRHSQKKQHSPRAVVEAVLVPDAMLSHEFVCRSSSHGDRKPKT